jgi:hypothetical protein
MRPEAFSTCAVCTDEQIERAQVALVVDLLVRSHPSYTEVVPNKIFRKGPS